MKVVCLLGSPRQDGNSAALAKHFGAAAEKQGAVVQTYALNTLNFKGCQGCMACKTKSEECVLKDDLKEVLSQVRQADVLVMASPIYLGEVSSPLRAFIERTYSFFTPDFLTNPNPSRLSPGKKLVFIQTQGQPNEKLFGDVFPRIEPFFKRYGYAERHLIRACGVRKPGEVKDRAEVMDLAERTAQTLVEGK